MRYPDTQALATISFGYRRFLLFILIAAYLFSITQRSSLGVAGIYAVDKFGINATLLAFLGVVQLLVYAAAQIPVGMFLDRFGPTRVMFVGSMTMAVGQAIVSFAPEFWIAIVGRMLVGLGDATTFISGMRIIASWFSPKKVPVIQQFFGATGQLGQIISAIPFAFILHFAGWMPAFLGVGSASAIAAICAIFMLKDSPNMRFVSSSVSLRGAIAKLCQVIRHPGTRIGFWCHFSNQFPVTVFSLLWGYPFMVYGIGLSAQVASILLIAPVVVAFFSAPFVGMLTSKYPDRRWFIVFLFSIFTALAFIAAIVFPQQRFVFLLILIFIVGVTGTGATIGFDYVRTYNPPDVYGTASGFVNIGGFSATSASMLLIGILIDIVGRRADGFVPYESFQVALWAVPAILFIGIVGLLFEKRNLCKSLQRDQ